MKKQNHVRAGFVSTQGITLIALIITIIVMLILAGVALSLTLGKNGIFKTAKDSGIKYNKQEAREKLELVLLDMQADKLINSSYNQDEYLTSKIEENGMTVNGNIVTVENWQFEIDRTVPKIVESNEDKEIGKTGLIAWYDGIENTGNGHNYDVATWKDLTENNSKGATINGATWTKDGLYFDGSNDWVNINSILMPEESDFTIDIVMSQNSYTSNYVFAQSNTETNGRTGICASDGNNGITFHTLSSTDYMVIDSEYIPKLTEKVNVTITRSEDKFTIWINGQKSKEQQNTYGKVLQLNTILGKWGLENKYYLNGVIHSIKAYDVELSKEEIEKNYKLNNERFNIEDKIGNAEIVKTGLIAWYDGIENTGSRHDYDITTWKDLTENNIKGATINGAVWTPNGLYFDGSNDWVDMNSILMPEESDFTIDIVMSQSIYYSGYVFAQSNKSANGRTGICVSDGNNGIAFHSLSSTDYQVVDSKCVPRRTEKVNVTITRNEDKFTIWINGQKSKEQQNTYGKVLQANTILGKWGLENKYYFNGIVYSVKAYDRELNNQEIGQNYNANRLRFNM